jgi:PKD repeat protein
MKKYSFLFAMVMVLILKAQIPIAKFLSSIDPAVPTGNSVLFSNQSTGNSLSYLWDFGNGTTSTLQDPPAVAYATTGSYLVKLTVTDTSTAKSSTVTNAILVGNSNTIDLSTGKTDTGALLPFLDDGKGGASVDELHWKFLYADGSTTTEKTRHYYTGWSYPTGPPVNNGGLPNSTWIYCPGCTDGTEFYNHISPTFNIPESATDAKLWLKALSFVRNWVYLVKINDDGSNTENLIAATSWRSDGAKGWLNSRNPLVDGMALSPGKYFVKVKVYSNNSQVSESLAVNAVANYGAGVGTVPSVSFGMVGDAPVCTKSSVIFRTVTDGAPIGYDWTFTSGNNIVKATGAMPSVTFSTPGVYTAELRTIFSNGLSSSFSIPNYVLVKDCDFSRAPNSYILDVNEPHSGLYIPVIKAYDAWKNSEFLKKQEASDPIPEGTQSASVYWEDVPGLIQEVGIKSEGEPDQSKIKVSVDKTKGKGNAVIAFKVNDKIYWSWHIWVTDDPSNGVTYTQGFETNIEGKEFRPQYMDRNLGATSSSFLGNDWHKSGGLMYQWGRKDPFLLSK